MRKEDSTYVYEFINKKAEELFSENPIGKTLDECFSEFHNRTIIQQYNRAMSQKEICLLPRSSLCTIMKHILTKQQLFLFLIMEHLYISND